MSRVILTFETLHRLLAAERLLRGSESGEPPTGVLKNNEPAASASGQAPVEGTFKVRTTPTPPGLSASVCGMSLEIMRHEDLEAVLHRLESASSSPKGVHRLD